MALEIDDRSIAAVLKDIVGNLQQIIRAEVRLAKVEVREEMVKAKRASILIAAGGLFGVMALGFVLLGAVHLLSTVVEPWQAAVLVGVGAGAIGGALVATGATQLKHVELPPPRTVTSVQENIQWAKAQAK
jgi:uncharacterized membrane protein YqjE